MSSNARLDAAIGHHRAGRLTDAEVGYAQVLADEPGSPDALHLLGVLYHQTGRTQAATGLVRQALAKRPGFAAAWNSLGNILAATNDSAGAEHALRQAIALAPIYPEALGNLGALLDRTGRHAEAMDCYRQAIAQAPDRADTHYNLALVLRRLGRHAEADAGLQEALRLAPDHAEAAHARAQVLRDLNRPTEALALVRRALALRADHPDFLFTLATVSNALGDAAATEAALAAVVGRQPDRLEAVRPLALLLFQQGRREEAEPLLHRVLAGRPEDRACLHSLAQSLMDRGRPAEALPWWQRLHRLAPQDATILQALGRCALASGQTEQAAAIFADALAQTPDLPETQLELAACLIDLNRDRTRAQALAQRAAASLPASTAAQLILGRVYAWGGAFSKAAEAFRAALKLAPHHADAHRRLGILLAKQGDAGAGAIEHLETAIRLNPRLADTYLALAEEHLQANRTDQAEAVLRRGLTAASDKAEAACNLASLLIVRGRFLEAQHQLDIALTEQPKHPPSLVALAQLAWRQDRPAAALKHLEEALAESPHQPAARLLRALILLGRGALTIGWRDYTWRFQAKGYRDRPIGKPRWQGEALTDQRLLVWREQGLGDELLFGTCFPDLLVARPRLTVETDRRLVSLLVRSLPNATVRLDSAADREAETDAAADCDRHTPVGDLPRLLRPCLSAFPPRLDWLRPDPGLCAHWRARLDALGPDLKVGICWRSGLVSSYRAAAYSELSHWHPLLTIQGCHIISLQYDPTPAEQARLHPPTGPNATGDEPGPIAWPDLDLRNDLEAVSALISGLDLVISAPTAAAELAGALGVPVWRITQRFDWTCLGTAIRPWFPTMAVLPVRSGNWMDGTLAGAARRLRRLAYARSSALLPSTTAATTTTQRRSVPSDGPQAVTAFTPSKETAAHLVTMGRYAEAEPIWRALLQHRPKDRLLLHNYAMTLERLGRDPEAVAVYRRALSLQTVPAKTEEASHADRRAWAIIHGNLGNCLLRLNRAEEALRCQEHAHALAPDLAETHINLGAAFLALDRPNDAADSYRRAIDLAPDHATAHSNLGGALERLGRSDQAEACYRTALTLDAGQPDALCNLAFLSYCRGRWREAERLYRTALRHRPDFALARFNLATLLLRTGRLEAGWVTMEARFTATVLDNPRRPFGLPAWQGQTDTDAALLIVREQGLGDELLFASLYADAARRVGAVAILCDDRLTGLFGRAFPTTQLLPEPRRQTRRTLPAGTAATCQTPAGSLARWLRPTLSRFESSGAKESKPGPAQPLLIPQPERLAAARTWLDSLEPGLRVGLAWRSSLQTSLRRPSSMALTDWLPLLRWTGLRVVSLQYDDDSTERAALAEDHGLTLPKWPDIDLMNDLESAAALSASLDLVVSTGTAAAELAAAVGTPVWRLEDDNAWTFLGTACRPFFWNVRVWPTGGDRTAKHVAATITKHLRELAKPRPD